MHRRWIELICLAGIASLLTACEERELLPNQSASSREGPRSIRETIAELQGLGAIVDVPVFKLEPREIHEELTITGELRPEQSRIINPQMDGRLHFRRTLNVGDLVTKGELLAEIDDRDIQDEIRRQLQQIEINEEKVRLDQTSLEQKRNDLIVEFDLAAKGFSTAKEVERTENAVTQAELTLRQTEIGLERERVALDQAQRKLEKVPIEAPIGGMVVHASQLSGQDNSSSMVDENIMDLDGRLVGTGTQIFGIISHESFLARCWAPGKDKARLKVGQRADVTIISDREITVQGEIVKIDNLQNVMTHAYAVWFSLKEVDASFTSGLFVRSWVELNRHTGTLVVDKRFVKERNNRDIVQLVVDGKVTEAEVTIGLRQGNYVELVSGVAAGDMMIASEVLFEPGQTVSAVPVVPR